MTATPIGLLPTSNDSNPSGPDSGACLREKQENWLFGKLNEATTDKERRDAEAALCRAIGYHIRAVAYQRLARPATDDFVQETTMAVLQSIHQFRGDSKFSTWVQGLIQHKISDVLRDKYSNLEDITPEGTVETPGDDPAHELDNNILYEKIMQMASETDRLILNGKKMGFDDFEISKLVGVSHAALRKRWERLKEKIREELTR